jgi:hypothetical protein
MGALDLQRHASPLRAMLGLRQRKGAMTMYPSWGDSQIGVSPFPVERLSAVHSSSE